MEEFPNCKLIQETYLPKTLQECYDFEEELFNHVLGLVINTDKFAPRVKSSEKLLVRRGIKARPGDLVVVGSGLDLSCHIEPYHEGIKYFAVEVGVDLRSRKNMVDE